MAFEHLSLYIQISEVFEPVSCSLWKSDPLLIFFIFITLTRIVFKKRIAIMKLLHFCVIHDQFFWIFHDKTCIIHSFFSRKRVKSEMLSLFSRNEKWICFSFHSFREWKVKWKCLEIEIESEKWNENASRSRSRSEIGKKFSRILEKRDSRRLLLERHHFNLCLSCLLIYGYNMSAQAPLLCSRSLHLCQT